MSNSKQQQIVRLREMLKKWRRLALKKAQSFSDASGGGGRTGGGGSVNQTRRSISLPSAREGGSSRVPAGHLAVYVGEERRRFVIKTWYLSHPLFRALLKKTEEEMGFQQEGALALPCQIPFFEHLLRIIQSCSKSHSLHHHFSPPPHHHYDPLAAAAAGADEQYQELLLHLLQSSDLPPSPLSSTTLHHHLGYSLSRSASQAMVV